MGRRRRDVTGLQFALRGAQHLPDAARWVVYADDAYEPGWTCFDTRLACVPRWDYRLAGGLAPPLPPTARRLSIYAGTGRGTRPSATSRCVAAAQAAAARTAARMAWTSSVFST